MNSDVWNIPINKSSHVSMFALHIEIVSEMLWGTTPPFPSWTLVLLLQVVWIWGCNAQSCYRMESFNIQVLKFILMKNKWFQLEFWLFSVYANIWVTYICAHCAFKFRCNRFNFYKATAILVVGFFYIIKLSIICFLNVTMIRDTSIILKLFYVQVINYQ